MHGSAQQTQVIVIQPYICSLVASSYSRLPSLGQIILTSWRHEIEKLLLKLEEVSLQSCKLANGVLLSMCKLNEIPESLPRSRRDMLPLEIKILDLSNNSSRKINVAVVFQYFNFKSCCRQLNS